MVRVSRTQDHRAGDAMGELPGILPGVMPSLLTTLRRVGLIGAGDRSTSRASSRNENVVGQFKNRPTTGKEVR